jgi:hypothetical protein
MDTLAVTLPVLGLHDSMLAGCFLREAPYLVRMGSYDAVRCLREAASAVERGREAVSLTTTSAALAPLHFSCVQLAGSTYRSNPAIPVLRAIAEACEIELGKAA